MQCHGNKKNKFHALCLGVICLGRFCISAYAAGHDNQISRQQVLHDSRDAFYRSPGWATTAPYRTGAVPCGTTVRLRLRTAAGDLTSCFIRGWDNDTLAEVLIPMNAEKTDGTYDYWQGQESFSKVVDLYYAFRLVDGDKEMWYQDDACHDGGIGALTDKHEYFWDYSIVWYDRNFTTPTWHTRAVIYQIMTDGFYNGNSANDPAGDGKSGDICWWQWDKNGTASPNFAEGSVYVCKKNRGAVRTGGNDFYGGDFQGVGAKCSYLKNLGVTAIYFNPWMESSDNHGYSVNDYKSVCPYYGIIDHRIPYDTNTNIVVNNAAGSLAQFDSMRTALEAEGIHIIADMVLNHCGAQSRYFQRFEHRSPDWHIYDPWPDEDGAYESKTSHWSDWFCFTEWNHHYQSWADYPNLPQIQYTNNTALRDLIAGPESVFDFWNSHGVGGYRLDVNTDYADGSRSRTVNRAIRSKVKTLDTAAVVIAENWTRANAWLAGDMCDGTMNYRFRNAVLDWVNGISTTEFLNNRLCAIQEDYPVAAQYASWALLGSHDTPRIRTVLGSADKQRLAVIVQFSHLGPPVIWAGDELGMTGGNDPDNRRYMEWELATNDNKTLTLYKTLAQARTTCPALSQGWIVSLRVDDNIYAYGREFSNDTHVSDAIVILNRAGSDTNITVDLNPLPGLNACKKLYDALTGNMYSVSPAKTVTLTAPAVNGVILIDTTMDMEKKTK